MEKIVFGIYVFLYFVAATLPPALAQQFRTSGGCGVQCLYQQRPLSKIQITTSGYRRVLVERKYSNNGGASFRTSEKIWLIADCQRGRVTWSFDSEGRDGWWHEAFLDDGTPSSSSANLHAHDHLQALCLAKIEDESQNIVVISFRGSDPSSGSSNQRPGRRGMDILSDTLQQQLSNQANLSSQVFDFHEVEKAIEWVKQLEDIECLVVAGNSRGGAAVIDFATDMLFTSPNQLINLSVQIDSVDLPLVEYPKDNILPRNIVQGVNYYVERSNGNTFPGVEKNVAGAENINVNNIRGFQCGDSRASECTHTNIHASPALHEKILENIRTVCKRKLN